MSEPITEGGVFIPNKQVSVPEGMEGELVVQLPDESEVARRLAALEAFIGSVKAPPGFDARKISREDLYD